MPKYLYECTVCLELCHRIVNYDDRDKVKCDICGHDMKRQPVCTKNVVINEVLDRYRNKACRKDIGKIMRDRSVKHTKKHGLGELIEKHGIENVKRTFPLKKEKACI